MNQNTPPNPFFSVGVTTYNRIDLLRHSIKSLLEQDFTDFEIIIGNDYLAETLTKEMIGYDDERVIIVNNNQNLGELGNMNSLLNMAQGKYFSWQFDDDLCAPTFLSEVYAALVKSHFPLTAYTSFTYAYGDSIVKFKNTEKESLKIFSGREFLRLYLSGTKRALGSGGFHDTDYLRSLGGAERLSTGHMALYSEYILIIRDGLLNEVVYIDNKLVVSRVHASSWSCNSSQVELFKEAGINLIRESLLVLSDPRLKDDFQKNLNSLLKSIVSVVIVKKYMSGKRMENKELDDYLFQIHEELKSLQSRELFECSLKSLHIVKINIPLFRLKAMLKVLIPEKRLKYVHLILSFVSKFTNKSF